MANPTILTSTIVALSLLAVPPARAQISVQGKTIRESESRPGDIYSGSFVVVNSSSEPQEAKVYQTDYSTSADGRNAYGPAGSSPRSNGKWVAVGGATLIVPPQSSREVPFTVTVPADPTLAGTYWSMVMVEGVPRASAESRQPSRAQPAVQAAVVTRIRYAVQIVTHVGPATKPAARFAAPTVRTAKDGGKVLAFDVINAGTRSFAPAFALELYAEDGARVKSAAAVREITYPGTSLRQQFDLGALPAGTYRALVTMDAGHDAVFGAQYTLKL
jgi:hypothetical protein